VGSPCLLVVLGRLAYWSSFVMVAGHTYALPDRLLALVPFLVKFWDCVGLSCIRSAPHAIEGCYRYLLTDC